MSALTKTLIILLTISSIFLCGIVVTYVAWVDNYRDLYDALKTEHDATVQKMQAAEKARVDTLGKSQQTEDDLKSQINELTADKNKLEADLRAAETKRDQLEQRVDGWMAQVQDFRATNATLQQSLNNALAEVKRLEAEETKNQKELEDLTQTLEEKLAIITMLNQKTKRLLEENTQLQGRLDKVLQPIGKQPPIPVPVTPTTEKVKPVPPPVRKVELKGLVTAVDPKWKMASISIGRADGVREGMKFHVTREDKFLCNIIILDVEAEQAVGFLDLVQEQPKTGDHVATSL